MVRSKQSGDISAMPFHPELFENALDAVSWARARKATGRPASAGGGK